jgi:ubiquinol-cytochrome c reductase iron-sulfur subunit
VDWGTIVSNGEGHPGQPSDAELNAMSREELVALGGRLDGVETVFKEPRWPIAGTKAEKRAERLVAIWLLLGGLFGLALLWCSCSGRGNTSRAGPRAASCTP